ncbi:hypothetical protein H7X46_28740 [Pseudonocardia sp. C8]|uniref:hypothetical protein n=1 Tax=Pseudonocardia sp. C8 TaxID=2762759 RepID=UPI0016425EE4|nr:hypothetical protein [Pseudonocardia sp. C8]MBC3195047.1 hypothetical protein [Pseudonocardia sp. C8]
MNRRSTRTTRTGLVAGLWVAAAAGALLLGLTAVGQIGSGLSGGDPVRPLAAEEVEAALARHAAAQHRQPAPQPPATQPPAARPAPQAQARVVPAGPAGTVLVRCEGGTPRVVSVNPAQGFEREDDEDVAAGQVAFDGDDLDVRVALSCTNGVPAGRVSTLGEG